MLDELSNEFYMNSVHALVKSDLWNKMKEIYFV